MIDSTLPLPLYHQVAGILRQRIEEGTYPVGARLQSEDEFAAEFDVSRATVRQATGELVMEGLIVRSQGRGTFVANPPPGRSVLKQRFRGSLSELIAESHRAGTRDIEVQHDAQFPTYVGKALHLAKPFGTIVRRTRMMDGAPFSYTVSYLVPEIGKKAASVAGLRRKALMELLAEHGVSLSSATQSIRAQLADVELCGRIDVELGAPLLYVERLVQDDSGEPVEFVRSWYRGDRYEYTVTLDIDPGSQAGPYVNLA
jgi:GntR family transcriptional regulator